MSNAGVLHVQVPFHLRDDETPDDWQCADNIWDGEHASCSVPQALTDEEIDEILALQVTLQWPSLQQSLFSFFLNISLSHFCVGMYLKLLESFATLGAGDCA